MKFLRIAALCVLISALLMLFIIPAIAAYAAAYARDVKGAASISHEDSPSDIRNDSLFPELDESAISALLIKTPEQSFEFRRTAPGGISVNGKQADQEIFSTLVSQIQELPVAALHAFSPKDTPAMTLVIFTRDGVSHTARFYAGVSGAPARIASGPENAPVYHQTEAWRIGTLIMTCEGTRIQDASGNELPAVMP